MAKARPKAPAIDRAIAAFKKAHPSCAHNVRAFKRRSTQTIRVWGAETPDGVHGQFAVWSYSDNGSLRRVS